MIRQVMIYTVITLSAIVLWVFVPGALAIGQEGGDAAPEEEKMSTLDQARVSYTYTSSLKRGPFVSLIVEIKHEEGPSGPRPTDPRQLFDVDLFRVVAIILDQESGGKIGHASVRLPDGKYYTLEVGTKVGIHGGHVKEMLLDRVIITQEVLNFRREKVEQVRELKLREEEGK